MLRKIPHSVLTIIFVGLLGILSEAESAIVPANSTSIHQDVLIDSYIFSGRKSGVDVYSEDTDLDARSLIRKYGYRGETHEVTTADGYILEMHRITGPTTNSNPEGKKVAFIMPGLLSSSIDWIIPGPEKAFAYTLADEGYDVWVGNARRIHHSGTQKKYSVFEKKYWTFGQHDVGSGDLQAQIDYIIRKTGQDKIFKDDHNQGTTNFFIIESEKPEFDEKVYAMVSFAPFGSSCSCSSSGSGSSSSSASSGSSSPGSSSSGSSSSGSGSPWGKNPNRSLRSHLHLVD